MNDGNFLCSLRHLNAIVKIGTNGNVLWVMGGKYATIKVSEEDMFWRQHDAYQLKDGDIAVFSNGDSLHPYCEGLLYKVDETHDTAFVVKRYCGGSYSFAQGSCNILDGICILDYGIFPPSASGGKQKVAEVVAGDGEQVASVFLPKCNYSYQITPTYLDFDQGSPEVKKSGKKLVVKPIPGFDYYWYRIVGDSAAIPVSLPGTIFAPKKRGEYAVDARPQGNKILPNRVSVIYWGRHRKERKK
jgi:hypothetical protein